MCSRLRGIKTAAPIEYSRLHSKAQQQVSETDKRMENAKSNLESAKTQFAETDKQVAAQFGCPTVAWLAVLPSGLLSLLATWRKKKGCLGWLRVPSLLLS